jgi:diguanylate cyclase (GGDEF)-like protein
VDRRSLLQGSDFQSILDQFLDARVQESKSRARESTAFTLCILVYLGLMSSLTFPEIPNVLKGITAQFEVLLSIYMALSFSRRGFWAGILLNIGNIILIFLSIIFVKNENAVTGIVVNIFAIISIFIISALMKRFTQQIKEVTRQREELLYLSKEILTSEAELKKQNLELQNSYQVIKSDEEKLNHLAYFDTLTELPNRKMILDRLNLLVNLSHQNGLSFSVVFIDLDDFKKINDSMGHLVGDALIVSVASRLNEFVDKNDILGRLGGDEFALIIQQDLKDEDIFQYVENLRRSLETSFIVETHELHIKASFGISKYPRDGVDPNELIRCADTAMYKAKETGKNGIYFFDRDMLDEILKRVDFENHMDAALKNNEFFLVFQPQYNTGDSTLRGFETLVRWQSPDYGLLSPLQFIPVAEDTRFIIPLGEWILRTACTMIVELMAVHQLPDIVLSVNISGIQFDDPNFSNMLKSILEETRLPAQNLELEITESMMIGSLDQTRQIMDELKTMGVKIALDDFGTGYSSLRYLQLLPIDTLKIDKSFIDNMNENERNKQVIGAIISLIHQLNIIVVAEGVENEQQLNYLREEKCDGIQGFLLGKPLSLQELAEYLVQDTRTRAA